MVRTIDKARRMERQAARSFLIALRARGVPEAVAVHVARGAIEAYLRHLGRGRVKRALEYISEKRAGYLADQLMSGIRMPTAASRKEGRNHVA